VFIETTGQITNYFNDIIDVPVKAQTIKISAIIDKISHFTDIPAFNIRTVIKSVFMLLPQVI